MMMAPPCTSFSIVQNSTCPIRSKRYPRGLPRLPADRKARVRIGKLFLKFVVQVVRVCVRERVPFCIERPQSSYMWHDQVLCQALNAAGAKYCDIHQCQVGSVHRKATRLAFGCCDELDLGPIGCPLQSRCRGKHGYCSATGRKHVVVEGSRATAASAAYPPRLADALGQALLSASVLRRGTNIFSLRCELPIRASVPALDSGCVLNRFSWLYDWPQGRFGLQLHSSSESLKSRSSNRIVLR